MVPSKATKLAEFLLTTCCVTGIRGPSGKFREIDNEQVLVRKISEAIREFCDTDEFQTA